MTQPQRTLITAEPGTSGLIIVREFAAPRELVFQAYTDPQLYVKWLGPRRLTMTLEMFEPRSGGSWRYTHSDDNGNQYAFRGVYHEVKAPERIVGTFEFEGSEGFINLETTRFEAVSEHSTKLIARSLYPSPAARDSDLRHAEAGINESFERLDELLAGLAPS